MSLYSPVQPIPKTILFLTRSLDRGGAERQLVVLVKGLASRGHPVSVTVFFGGGAFESELAGVGVRVINLGKQGRWDILPFLNRLVGLLRKERPTVIHSYLGVPNILVAVLKPLLPGTRIVWGVRASNMDLSRYDWLSRLAYALERRLVRFADRIISNSEAGKCHAIANGFPEGKMVVIPNGIDTEYFRFDPERRRQVRLAWGVGEDEILVGLAARLDPMKDHRVFLDAASLIASEHRNVRFVCVGGGPADYAEALKQHAAALGLTNQLIWVGAQDDMPAVYSALDIAASSSAYGEGFSNAIAEAMACGVPCVVTDVGDSAPIVGDTGNVVPAGDHRALAAEIQRLTNLSPDQRREMGEACRARVVSEFGIDRLVQRTEKVLDLV
ncbi:glycosyltransferase [Laribacter hongkongensis]|uniref:glycosyltransferase n=1 Tax=Laribacter hongkongensis TaxID=168471 RepID=UPI001EFCAF66|nr:glycosyltransferase [Laribacter hongkongensis]MCG9107127.1 glycosyltransferase [Laribacter hongkongensis]